MADPCVNASCNNNSGGYTCDCFSNYQKRGSSNEMIRNWYKLKIISEYNVQVTRWAHNFHPQCRRARVSWGILFIKYYYEFEQCCPFHQKSPDTNVCFRTKPLKCKGKKNGGCSHTCSKEGCSCPSGWKLKADGLTCVSTRNEQLNATCIMQGLWKYILLLCSHHTKVTENRPLDGMLGIQSLIFYYTLRKMLKKWILLLNIPMQLKCSWYTSVQKR